MKRFNRIQAVRLCRRATRIRVSEPFIDGDMVRVEMSMRLKPSEFLDTGRSPSRDHIEELLPPKMLRYAIEYASGKPVKAIAEDAGRTRSAVSTLLVDARKKLRCQSVLQMARVFWEAGFLDEAED